MPKPCGGSVAAEMYLERAVSAISQMGKQANGSATTCPRAGSLDIGKRGFK